LFLRNFQKPKKLKPRHKIKIQRAPENEQFMYYKYIQELSIRMKYEYSKIFDFGSRKS